MQRCALDILGERYLVDQHIGAGLRHHARDRRDLGEALLLDQQFQRPEAATARWHLEHAGFLALGIHDRADMQGLDQAATGDRLGQLLNRDPGLDAPDVGLAEHQFVEGNVARGRQGDLLNGSGHVSYSMTDAGEPLSPAISPSRSEAPPSSSEESDASRRT